jgi:hypothetical protein
MSSGKSEVPESELGRRLRQLSLLIHDGERERIRHMVGKLLTVVDGAITDPVQRKAVKDMVESIVWGTAVDLERDVKETIGFLCDTLEEPHAWTGGGERCALNPFEAGQGKISK